MPCVRYSSPAFHYNNVFFCLLKSEGELGSLRNRDAKIICKTQPVTEKSKRESARLCENKLCKPRTVSLLYNSARLNWIFFFTSSGPNDRGHEKLA